MLRKIRDVFILVIIVSFIIYAIYGIKEVLETISDKQKNDIKQEQIKLKQEKLHSIKVYQEDVCGCYYIVDIPINGVRHEYLKHSAGFYSSESMCHYPECKYCKDRNSK